MPYNAERYRYKKKNGICADCNRKALKGLTRCAFHHEMMLEKHRRYYRNHRARLLRKKADEQARMVREGRCRHCFTPMYTDGNFCPTCLEEDRLRK